MLTSIESGSIETYIKRSDVNRLKMAISSKGKLAQTDYALLDDYLGKLSLVKLTLHTGRTHQIRVHMSSLGHPVVADDLYGSNLTKYFNTLDADIQVLIKGLKISQIPTHKVRRTRNQKSGFLKKKKKKKRRHIRNGLTMIVFVF